MSDDVCQVRMGDTWHRYPCGRPVKEDGLCGIHLAAKQKVARNDAVRKAQESEIEATVARLREYGLTARPARDHSFRMTGEAIVSPEELLALLARLSVVPGE